MPKGSTKEALLQQVKHIIDIEQPLDDDRISSNDTTMARLHMSIDSISLLSSVTWETNQSELLSIFRGKKTPRINATYIN